jgi:hypothetical protein
MKGLYVGKELSGPSGNNSLKLLLLQLTAKVLELLVLASLSAILFDKLRSHMVSEEGVPLGAIAACFQVSAMSNFWSQDLISLFRTRFGKLSYQILFIGLILIVTLLGLVIGPSSAFALQPILDNWSAGGTVFWLNATSTELFPPLLNGSFIPDYSCTPGSASDCISRVWNPLADGMLSFWPQISRNYSVPPQAVETAFIPGRDSIRSLAVHLVGPFGFNPGLSVATIQQSAIASAVAQMCALWQKSNNIACNQKRNACFHYFNDIICSTGTLQPAVFVRCNAQSQTSTPRFWTLNSSVETDVLIDYEDPEVESQDWFDSVTSNASHQGIKWIDLPEESFSQASLGVLIAVPKPQGGEDASQVFSCSVNARWVNSTVDVSFLAGPYIASSSVQREILEGKFHDGQGVSDYPLAKMDTTWAEGVNIIIPNENITVFQKLCKAEGVWDHDVRAQEPMHAMEAILSLLLVQGMGLTGHQSTIQGTLRGLGQGDLWQKEFLPLHGSFGNGGEVYEVNDTTKSKYPKLSFTVKANGYAYNRSTATFLSTTTLLVYAVIALSHVLYSVIFTRTSSSSWDTVSEMIVLALKSEKQAGLNNTGAGISNSEIFEKPVRVHVVECQLEQEVGNKGVMKDNQRVKENGRYGQFHAACCLFYHII